MITDQYYYFNNSQQQCGVDLQYVQTISYPAAVTKCYRNLSEGLYNSDHHDVQWRSQEFYSVGV